MAHIKKRKYSYMFQLLPSAIFREYCYLKAQHYYKALLCADGKVCNGSRPLKHLCTMLYKKNMSK